MKVTVEIDCTPAEARQFLGLPDVEVLQKKIMSEVEQRMLAEMDRFSPESTLKGWLNFSPASMGPMQEAFGKLFQPNLGEGQKPSKRGGTE